MTVWVFHGGVLAADQRHSHVFKEVVLNAIEETTIGTYDDTTRILPGSNITAAIDTAHTLESKIQAIKVATSDGEVTLYAVGSGKRSIVSFLTSLAAESFHRNGNTWNDATTAAIQRLNTIPERAPFSSSALCLIVWKEAFLHIQYTAGDNGGYTICSGTPDVNLMLLNVEDLRRFFRISSHVNKDDTIPYAARVAAQTCYLYPDACSPPIDYVNVLDDAPAIKTLSLEDVEAYAVRSGMIYRPPAPPQDAKKP